MKFTVDVEVEVFPDGVNSWIVRGAAQFTADPSTRRTFEWWDIAADSEAQAEQIAALTMAQALIDARTGAQSQP